MHLLASADLFENNHFIKFFQEHYQGIKQFWFKVFVKVVIRQQKMLRNYMYVRIIKSKMVAANIAAIHNYLIVYKRNIFVIEI